MQTYFSEITAATPELSPSIQGRPSRHRPYPDTVTALMAKLINQHNKAVTPPAKVLPHARLHDLRHLHATTLLLAGVPVHVVAARLGHADPAVTLRVYSQAVRASAISPLANQSDRDDQVSLSLGVRPLSAYQGAPTQRHSFR